MFPTLILIMSSVTAGHGTVSTQAEVLERLAPVFATQDPVRVALAYRAMGDYGAPAAGTVESMIREAAQARLADGDIAGALSLSELNVATFPASASAWESLGAILARSGDRDDALRCFRVALEIDPANIDALRMIERLGGWSNHAADD